MTKRSKETATEREERLRKERMEANESIKRSLRLKKGPNARKYKKIIDKGGKLLPVDSKVEEVILADLGEKKDD